MKRISLIFTMILFCGFCIAQNTNTTNTTKTMSMTFEEYSEGDYPHFIFKDLKSGQEYDFRFLSENKLGNLNLLLDDDNASFGSKANPKYLKKKFSVVAIKKSVLDSDLNGNTIKTKAWVISKISLNNSNETNNANLKLPFIGMQEFDFYHPASSLAPTYHVTIKSNGDVLLGFSGGSYSGSKEVNIGKYAKVMNISSFETILDEKYCVITKDNMYLSDQFGNKIIKDGCCKFQDEHNCPCESKLYPFDNSIKYNDINVDVKYNGPVTILFNKNAPALLPLDKIDELNKLIEFLKQNKNYKYKIVNYLYAEHNEFETQGMLDRLNNINDHFNSNNIDYTRKAKIQSIEAYDQISSDVRKVTIKLVEE